MAMEGIYAFADQIKVYKAILDATQEIQGWLRYNSGKSSQTWRRSYINLAKIKYFESSETNVICF